jgi:hypothetical protein
VAFGEIASCRSTMEEAILVAKQLNETHGLGVALFFATGLGYIEHNPADVERFASDLIELSTRQNILHFRALGTALLGWARSASGRTAEGISWIQDGIEELRVNGMLFNMLSLLALKAEALHLADRSLEALENIKQALVEASEARWWSAELYRLRGVFLATLNADDTQIEASFSAAVRTAKQQKSISLEKRAEATYAEYLRQKASRSGGRGFRIPLW